MRKAIKMCSLKRSIIMSVSNAHTKTGLLTKESNTHKTKKYLIHYVGTDRQTTDFKVTDLKTNLVYPVSLYHFYGGWEWEVYEPQEIEQ